MSGKAEKKSTSAKYSLQKAGQKIAAYKPSSLVLALVVMGISIFLLGGGIYDIFLEPLAILPIGSGRFLSYLPYRIHEQLLIGSIGVMILYAIGATGLLMLYRSTRYVRNPRQLSLLSKIGVALFLISFVAIEAELFWILNFPSQ